jgi:hypothetical protein
MFQFPGFGAGNHASQQQGARENEYYFHREREPTGQIVSEQADKRRHSRTGRIFLGTSPTSAGRGARHVPDRSTFTRQRVREMVMGLAWSAPLRAATSHAGGQ